MPLAPSGSLSNSQPTCHLRLVSPLGLGVGRKGEPLLGVSGLKAGLPGLPKPPCALAPRFPFPLFRFFPPQQSRASITYATVATGTYTRVAKSARSASSVASDA